MLQLTSNYCDAQIGLPVIGCPAVGTVHPVCHTSGSGERDNCHAGNSDSGEKDKNPCGGDECFEWIPGSLVCHLFTVS